MARPKLILEEGGQDQFDFNDGVTTRLNEQIMVSGVLSAYFKIPAAKPTSLGDIKRSRRQALSAADWQMNTLSIPFKLVGEPTTEQIFAKQRTLARALAKDHNVLTWNPDPDTCPYDIYFDTCPSTFDLALDKAFFGAKYGQFAVDILVFPFPYGPEQTLFDSSLLLSDPTTYAAQWNANQSFSIVSSPCIGGLTAVQDHATVSPFEPGVYQIIPIGQAIDFTPYLTTGWVTIWVYPQSDSGTADWSGASLQVNIGNAAGGGYYRLWQGLTPLDGKGFHEGKWACVFFNLNSGFTITGGTPDMAAVDKLVFQINGMTEAVSAVFDNAHVVNGAVGNVRGKSPLNIFTYGCDGEIEPGFRMVLSSASEVPMIQGDGEQNSSYSVFDSSDSSCGIATSPVTSTYYQTTAKAVQGSKLVELDFAYWQTQASMAAIQRTLPGVLDLSPYEPQGNFSIYLMAACQIPSGDVVIKIGSSSSVYYSYSFSAMAIQTGWQKITAPLSAFTVAAGSPSWSNISWVSVVISGNQISGTTIPNNTVWFDGGVVSSPAANPNQIWMGRRKEINTVVGVPGSFPDPEKAGSIVIPAGFTDSLSDAGELIQDTSAYAGRYRSYTFSSTWVYIFPIVLPADLYSGQFRLLGRLAHNFSGGLNVIVDGWDTNSVNFAMLPQTSVPYNNGNWQIADFCNIEFPLFGFNRDANLANQYSVIFLACQFPGASGNQVLKVDYLEVLSSDGGARYCSPSIGKSYSEIDYRYVDYQGFAQGSGPDADMMSVEKISTQGDLDDLALESTNLSIIA